MHYNLWIAVADGNLKEFQRIESVLKNAFDINWGDEGGFTFLMRGSFRGRIDIVKYLLGKGALVDQKDKYGGTALYAALGGNHLDVARLLLESGADPNVQPYDVSCAFPLYSAAQYNQPEACELLLGFGANLDQKSAYGMTSLDIAIHLNNTKLIKILQAATD